MIFLSYIQETLIILLNLEQKEIPETGENSYFLNLITDITLITSLCLFTLFFIVSQLQNTFKTHSKFQNQVKNLPKEIKEKLNKEDSEIGEEEDHWGEFVTVFYCFGPRTARKMIRRKHKKIWSKEDIDVFYRFYIKRYFNVFFVISLLIQILKIMRMRALYQHLPLYFVYLIGVPAFLSSRAHLNYYVKEDAIFEWYVEGGGGSFIYCCLCFVVLQEVIGVIFKWGFFKFLGIS